MKFTQKLWDEWAVLVKANTEDEETARKYILEFAYYFDEDHTFLLPSKVLAHTIEVLKK